MAFVDVEHLLEGVEDYYANHKTHFEAKES